MDKERARQIMDAKGVIEVMHEDQSVWIENLHGDQAEVTFIGTDRREVIPLNQLIESMR